MEMIGLEKFLPSARDTWRWELAQVADIWPIVAFSKEIYQREVDQLFTPDTARFAHHIHLAIVDQIYELRKQQIIVAKNKTTNELMAWAWLARGSYTTYAPEEMAEAKFVHIDLKLPTRTRITLTAQILHQWQIWCQLSGVPILVSTSIRSDQDTFMRLHEQAGFSVRGSYAYKKITL